MKKITIITAIAAIFAVSPLLVGCSGETETANPDDDEAQQPVPGEGGGETGGEETGGEEGAEGGN
jgi:hypothetical protein|tara:strand:- start:38 stop:232 length:195 start_codon:yes stop_codon:yes gene_type:complete